MADYFNMNPATGKPYDDAWINKNGAGAFLQQGGQTWDAGSSKDGGYTANQLAPGQLLPGQTQPSPSQGWFGNTPANTAGPGSPGYVPQQYGAPQGGSMTGTAGGYPATGYAPPQQTQPGPASGGGNPYLEAQGGAIARRMNDNMDRNVMPQIRQGAMAAGGYGGSRQGVLEANAYKDMNLGLGDSLANLYGTDWTNQQNRDLSRYGMDQNNTTALRGQDISRYGMDQNFYSNQRSQDMAQVGLGADLYSKGMNGEWDPIKNASQTYSPYTGLNSTTTQNQNSGGGFMGAVGGAMGAYDFYKNFTK